MRYSHSTTKFSTNTPKGVGADSSCPYPSIIKNVYIRYQIRISTLLNIYIHFNSNAFPSPFCRYLRIRGHDKSAPTAADSLLITLLANWNNVANTPQNIHIQPRNALLPICNNITFEKQKPYFCNAKTHFLHAKNHTFTRQKPYFCFVNM